MIDEGRRVVVYDPTGVWWGLRYGPLLEPGMKVAHVGGQFGDVPLVPADGERLGRFCGTYDGAIIVDTSELLIGDKHKFALGFFRALYETNRKPLYLVIDEADEVAPQNPLRDVRVLLHQVDRIVRRGRVRGFIVTLISQRPAVLHKNVLSQAGTLVAMQLTASQDRNAVKAWIEGQADVETGKGVLARLPQLETGEGFVWSPGAGVLQLVRFEMCGTYDSSRSPKHGEDPPAPPATRSYPGEFAELERLLVHSPPKPAKKKGRQAGESGPVLTSAPSNEAERINTAADPKALERARAEGFEKGRARGFEQGYAAASSTVAGAVRGVIVKAEAFLEELRAIAQKLAEHELEAAQRKAAVLERFDEAERIANRIAADPPAGEPWLRTLKVLAQRHPMRMTVKDWAAIAGMKSSGGAWGKHLKALREHELVELVDGLYGVTPGGLAAAGEVEQQPTTRDEVLELWGRKIGGKAAAMLATIVDRYPNWITRDELAEFVDMTPTGGAFQKQLRQLRQNGLVIAEGGSYRAGDLFELLP